MAAILDFRLKRFKQFLSYKSPQYFLPRFKSTGFSVQEKKRKINFQDGHHLGFSIRTIFAIFDLQVTPMLPIIPSFKSIGLSDQEKKPKIDFQDCRRILAIFDLRGSCKKFCHWVRITSVLRFIKHIFITNLQCIPPLLKHIL